LNRRSVTDEKELVMKATSRFFRRFAVIGRTAFFSLVFASLLTSSLLFAQSVTFDGAVTAVPFSGSGFFFRGLAIDSVGDVFITDESQGRVYELPRTEIGYGPQITLPFSGLIAPYGIAVDGADNLFVTNDNGISELPRVGAGYGAQIVLSTDTLSYPDPLALDNAGDIFFGNSGKLFELPREGSGYGPQIALPDIGGEAEGIAINGAGDVFVTLPFKNQVVELPRAGAGYGPLTILSRGVHAPWGIAVDKAGDIFVTSDRTVELPRTKTGYGPLTSLNQFGYVSTVVVALDSAENVFIVPSLSSPNIIVMELQRSSVNFGGTYSCAPGQTTPAPCSQTLTLGYNINADLTLGTPQVLTDGAPDRDFTLASGSTCMGAAPKASSCTVNVTFAPLSTGIRNGAVEIVDSSGKKLITTQIYGDGVEVTTGTPVVQVSSNYLQFATTAFGSSKTLPVTVTNVGGGTLTVVPSVSTYSGSPIRSYTIGGSTCGGGVTSGNSCTLEVEYSPKSIATHYGLLTLQTNGGVNPVVKLHGVAQGLSVLGGISSASLKFGSVSSGSTEVLPLTVTNVGLPGTVTIGTAVTVRATTRPTTTYKVLATAQNTCLAGIAAGQSCVLPVEFAPTTSGTHDDLLTLIPSAGGGSTNLWLIGSTP
jgi:hypothetical protein